MTTDAVQKIDAAEIGLSLACGSLQDLAGRMATTGPDSAMWNLVGLAAEGMVGKLETIERAVSELKGAGAEETVHGR